MPPFWLAGFVAVAWMQQRHFHLGVSLAYPVVQFLAGLLIGGGLVFIAMAILAFRRHRTTVVPHQIPDKMITGGIFARSRNPIYLGDALILAGMILWMDAILSLILLPLFVFLISRRFIMPEEDRLRRKFRADFARYVQKTPRWI